MAFGSIYSFDLCMDVFCGGFFKSKIRKQRYFYSEWFYRFFLISILFYHLISTSGQMLDWDLQDSFESRPGVSTKRCMRFIFLPWRSLLFNYWVSTTDLIMVILLDSGYNDIHFIYTYFFLYVEYIRCGTVSVSDGWKIVEDPTKRHPGCCPTFEKA